MELADQTSAYRLMAGPYAIPDVDGVPNINFSVGFSDGITLASDDAIGLSLQLSSPQWGIYQGGAPVVVADTILAFEYRQDWLVADYPMEQGGFSSYNKVQTPYDIRIRFAAGESEANRAALLASVQAIAGDTNLYDVVMPEQSWPNCNVVHFDFHRTAQAGVGLLAIDVYLQQIQQASQSSFDDDTASPSGASPYNGGQVQPAPATTSQANQINSNPFLFSSP